MILVLAAVLAATMLNPPTPIEETFVKGETLDYNLTWLKITGGTARMTIAPSDDASSFRITSVAASSPAFSRIFKVRDEIETVVAREDFSTLRYVKRLDEDGDKIEEITTIEDGVATRRRNEDGEKIEETTTIEDGVAVPRRNKVKRVNVPRPVMDPISVIYHLRTLDLSPGKTHELELIADGKRYTVQARVGRRERVQTPAGIFNCVRVEPRMLSGGVERQERLFIWYTDDERKLPVRIRSEIKVGAITASLRGTSSGVTSVDPPILAESKAK